MTLRRLHDHVFFVDTLGNVQEFNKQPGGSVTEHPNRWRRQRRPDGSRLPLLTLRTDEKRGPSVPRRQCVAEGGRRGPPP